MKFTLNIDSGNAGLQSFEDLAGVIRAVADKVDAGATTGHAMDYNGNGVGGFTVDLEPSPADRHLLELAAIGYDGNDLTPLLDLEDRAHRAAEDYCSVEGFDYDGASREIEAEVADLFGGETPDGFFLNGDPRGYALKLDEGTGAVTYRDWGGFEILAPDFN